MKNSMTNPLNYRLKTLTGFMVIAPEVVQKKENVDFLLIGEDGHEYHIKKGTKTNKMWSLVDNRMQVTGVLYKKSGSHHTMNVITFKCIDDYLDSDPLLVNQNNDFKPSRFDYAI